MNRSIAKLLAGAATLALSVSTANAAITVGGKNFTEQLIMASMTTQLLEANGFDVDKRDGMGSTVLRKAQVNGQVDVYWEYTGTSLITYNKMKSKGLSSQETEKKVREADKKKGLMWLECSGANNTYALAVKKGRDKTAGIESLSDLAEAYNNDKALKLAVDAEFSQREDGLPGVEKTYGFDVSRANLRTMDLGLTYKALNEGQVDVAMVFSTDGRIAAFDFRTLKDDKQFFPSYALCPVARQDTLKANPQLEDLLNNLAGELDNDTMRRLNKRVDVDKVSAEQVAREFLKKNDML